jgi:hypothetical protein
VPAAAALDRSGIDRRIVQRWTDRVAELASCVREREAQRCGLLACKRPRHSGPGTAARWRLIRPKRIYNF